MARTKFSRTKAAPRHPDTKYEDRFAKMAFGISLLGATDREMADIFGVSQGTISRWKRSHPEFGRAVTKGGTLASSKVAVALYKRAIGYSHPDTHISNYQGQVTITPIIKHYPPDTAAIKYFLNNKEKEKWSDVSRVENETHMHWHGDDTKLGDISTKELEMMEKLAMRNLLNEVKKKN